MTRYPARLPAGKFVVAILVLCAAAALIFAPVRIPSSIRIPGRMTPIREWSLTRARDGGFAAVLLDHGQGTVEISSIARFDQGDAVEFHLHPGITRNLTVGRGDTVGVIVSHILNGEIDFLRGRLAVAKASLAVALSGDKAEIVQEARNRVNRARVMADEQRRFVERQRALFVKEFISPQDFDTFESALKLAEAEVAIAESQFAAADTGSKREQVGLVRAEIGAIEKEIEVLEARRGRYTISSPIRGAVFRLSAGDTVVTLGDDSAYLLSMLVRLNDLTRIDRERPVRIYVRGLDTPLEGRISGVGNVVGIAWGEQVASVTAVIRTNCGKLNPGLIADCRIMCMPMSVRERVKSALGPIFIR